MRLLRFFRGRFTPTVVGRLVVGWGAVALTLSVNIPLPATMSVTLLGTVLMLTIGVIVVCAFGVVHEAERLAAQLGEPYGTLILTLSIVSIEVILIGAVMFADGKQPTIARDSVMAVSMIILNLVVGLALIVGGLRHPQLRAHPTGVSVYLAMLTVMLFIAFALPLFIGARGSYNAGQAALIAVLMLVMYTVFLLRQVGAQQEHFQEHSPRVGTRTAPTPTPMGSRGEVVTRASVLIAMVLPIVLLSQPLATLLDETVHRAGAPTALTGIVIAMIVFLPETMTAIRATYAGEMQRVSNLCHGALVSTVGLTVPVVLCVGLLTNQPVLLAEQPVNLALLAVSLLLSVVTFSAKHLTVVHGLAHTVIFIVYGISVFS